jgi:L-rhamnose-H+ transport protein
VTIIIGSVLCIFAGIGIGIFMLPLKYSRSWRWENTWSVGSIFAYVLMPLLALVISVPQCWKIYALTPSKDLRMIYIFGLIQGSGAFVQMYLCTVMGLALGFALTISCNALFSLLIPLFLAHRDRVAKIDGITLLIAAALLLVGFVLAGRAGLAREARAPAHEKEGGRKLAIPLLAIAILWSGFANSMYYFTFEFQKSMEVTATQKFGVAPFAWGFLNMFPFFLGLFTVNIALMGTKMVKEKTVSNFWAAPGLGREYLLGISMSLLWYLGQGVAYPAAQAILGPLGVAVGAALLMGTIMVASNVTGIRTGEWKGSSAQTMQILYTAIAILVVATAVAAIGNYLATRP